MPERCSASFSFTLDAGVAPEVALHRILDVKLHGQLVPFTRGRGCEPEDLQVGDRLVARTALGRWGFDDIMEVADLHPASSVRLCKVGSVVRGVIDVEVRPRGAGVHVTWSQSVVFPFLPQPLAECASKLAAPVLRRAYRSVVERLLSLPA